MDFEKIRIVSAYFPNSQRDHARLGFKLEFCAALEEATRTWGRGGRAVLVSGDYNIAHQPIDLKNPKANEKTAGFLPEEREWMSRFLHSGWIDTFRAKQPELRDQYSWWSYRPGVREKNIGWRIDYHCLSPWGGMQIDRAWIEMEVLGSDHAPVGLEISER
jgi:exodeoxyribonuclease-3